MRFAIVSIAKLPMGHGISQVTAQASSEMIWEGPSGVEPTFLSPARDDCSRASKEFTRGLWHGNSN
jgi:hypothetical protein